MDAITLLKQEMVFYPAVRGRVPKTEDTVLESLEEHHVVKWVLSEVEDLQPDHERFKAKMTVTPGRPRAVVDKAKTKLKAKVGGKA